VAVRAPGPANEQSANSIAALTRQDVDAMTLIMPSDRREREVVFGHLRGLRESDPAGKQKPQHYDSFGVYLKSRMITSTSWPSFGGRP